MLNILVVDDSSIITKTLSKHLVDFGLNVIGIAKNGTEAIEQYKKLHPDLVTMDITMPILNGIDALKEIRSFDSQAKVIMITSHGEERLVMDAITLGAKGYMLKPITPLKIKLSLQKSFPQLSERIESNYTTLSLIY